MKHSANTTKNAVASRVSTGAQEFLPIKWKGNNARKSKTLKAIAAWMVAAILGGALCGCSIAAQNPAETTDSVAYVAPVLSASEASEASPDKPEQPVAEEPKEAPEDGSMIGVIKPLEEPDTARQIALWVGTEYDFEAIPGKSRFMLASMPTPADFGAINTEIPQSVYRFPFCMDARGDSGQFCLPKDVRPEIVADAIEVAQNAAMTDLCIDYRTPEILKERAYKMRSRAEKGWQENVERVTAEYVADEIIYRGMFITDPSLVYIDTDGCTRVRGVSYLMLETSNKPISDVKVGVWYSRIVEYCLSDQNYIADVMGVTPWDPDHIHAFDHSLALEDSWWELGDNFETLFNIRKGDIT